MSGAGDSNLQNTTSNTGLPPIIQHENPALPSTREHRTGVHRLVKDLVAEFYNATQKWNDLLVEAAPIVKQIRIFKENHPRDMNAALEELVINLSGFVEQLKKVLNNLSGLTDQMNNAVKLQNSDDAGRRLFISMNAERLSQLFKEILEAYKAEFEMKQTVSESIAFSRDKYEATALAALWVYQTKIPKGINLKMEMLLTETGHRRFSSI